MAGRFGRRVVWAPPIALAALLAFAHVPASAELGDTANLSITGSASAPWIKVGHDFAFTLVVENQGPDAATNVTASFTIPDPDVVVQSAETTLGTCSTVVVCDLTTMGPNDRATIVVEVSASAPGLVDSTATVMSDTTDDDAMGNTATVSVKIGPLSDHCDMKGLGAADDLLGTPDRDVICGRSGRDVIHGGGGNDILVGGGGNDRLTGEAGDDRLRGQSGRDRLIGGSGRDRLSGGPGRDTCRGAGRNVSRGCP